VYLVTPFDSGGSSAALREAFDMPAVGDLRNRLLALADTESEARQAAAELFATRLPADSANGKLHEQLHLLIRAQHPLMQKLEAGMRNRICTTLASLLDRLPKDFNLRGASLGNLAITGNYLANGRDLAGCARWMAEMIGARGRVLPMVEDDLHLAATLADGETLVGQHRLTGKEAAPIQSAVRRLELSDSKDEYIPATCSINQYASDLIRQADLICYPPGSFFTSVCANLLPEGVAGAIAAASCRKVFIPNLGIDPEQKNLDSMDTLRMLLGTLMRQDSDGKKESSWLTDVLIDKNRTRYRGGFDRAELERLEIRLRDSVLVDSSNPQRYDPAGLAAELVGLAEHNVGAN
jgi:CofD-related protein of GAK system